MNKIIVYLVIGLFLMLSCTTNTEVVKKSFSVAEELGINVEISTIEDSLEVEKSISSSVSPIKAEIINKYGGITEETVFKENDYKQMKKQVEYFDDKKILMQRDIYPLELTTIETGYKTRRAIQVFRFGNTIQYVLFR